MELVFAGFGGQGVLTSGLIISEIALDTGKHVTWMPAYGPTMRGGKAYSVVKYSDEPVGGPDMEEIDILVAMNQPSLEYCSLVKKGGLVIVNSDGVSADAQIRNDVEVLRIPCLSLANKVNNPKAANIVVIGAIISMCNLFDKDKSIRILGEYFKEKGKDKYIKSNERAFLEGYNYTRQ